MNVYKKCYAILCAAASNALDTLPQTLQTQDARIILQDALWEAEELYITQAPEEVETP